MGFSSSPSRNLVITERGEGRDDARGCVRGTVRKGEKGVEGTVLRGSSLSV